MAKEASNAKKTKTTSPQTLIALGVILVIAAALIGYMGIYQPAQEELKKATINYNKKLDELDQVKKQEAEYLEFRKESDRLEHRLDDLKAKIPSTESELNKFLQSVTQRARSSRVGKWTLYKKEGRIPKGDISAIPIRMEFLSTYEAALQFFWELASMGDGVKVNNREQIINIRDVQITRQNGTKENPVAMVRVICVAETYLYTGGVAAQ